MRVRAKRLIACVLSLMMVLSMANGSLQLLGNALFASAAGENLALGKKVYASGTEVNDGRWKPDKVVDGVVSKESRWSSNTSDNAWITVDLGTPAEVGKVVLNWELKATRFKLQASDDNSNWQDIFTDYAETASPGENATIHKITLDAPVNARYIRMQGIQRTPVEPGGPVYGYSLYEFEIYAPDVVLPDAEAAQVVLDSINLPKSTQQNFTVPVSGIQDATIAWTSSHPEIIGIGADGTAVVTLPETSTVVTLTAAVTVGEVTLEKEFPVNVKSADEAPVSYTLYPLVQNMQATADIISITSTVNVVVDGSVDSATKAYLAKVLADNGLTAVYSDAAVEGSTNLLVGVSGSNSAVDQYFAGVSYDASAIAGHHDAYVLDVSDNSENGTIAILGKDSDAVYYAVATLRQMLETNSSRATVLTLTDWADTQFRGFIEGFYGLPWSYEDRVSLMEFGQQFKMNSYIYGPKDDPYHRDSWRELYPDDQLADIVKLVEKGLETKVEFIWGIHPGFDIDLFSEADYQSMIAKFEQLYDAGVRQFSIFMDDINTTQAYNEREQLVKVLNRVETEFVQAKGDVKPLIFVPSFYNKAWSTGSMGQSYLRALANLEPDIEIMWTGNSVMSDIDNNTIQWVRNLVGRDIYIWWNHPVNDYAKDSLLMGESYRLGNDVKNMSGFVSNPMNQAEASKVSLFSVADFTWNVGKFNQTTSWVHSFAFVAPDAAEALHTFSKNVSDPSPNGSGVVREESAYLTSTLNSFNSKLNAGQDLTEIGTQLADEFVNIQKACQELRASKANPGLVEEIEPWTRSLEQVALAGEKAVRAAMQLQDKNADPAAIWSNYSTASTAIQRAKTFTTLTDVGNTVVKAGSKRLQPFANNLIANLESRVRAAVLADLNDAKDTAKAYTNVAAYGQAAVTVGAASVTLEDLQDVTLQPGEYVGLQADTLKNVTEMTAQGLPDALTVQISENGVVWQEVPAEGFAGTVTAKYARVLNNTQQAARFDLTGFGFNTLAPLTGITGSLGGGMIVYSGSVNSTLDGNLNSLLWTKVQEIGQTITYNFGKQVPLFDVTMYMDTSDYLRQGVIEVSADGSEWTQIGLIDNTGSSKTYVNSFNAGGAKVQYARLRITADDSSWLKVNEFEFNKSMGTQNAQFVSCDIDGRIELSTDRNVSSYFTANENKAGAIVYKNVNNKTATEFVVLQDATNLSGAVVTIVSENGVKQIGTLDAAYNVFNISGNGYVYEMRISWNDGGAPTIFELGTTNNEVTPPEPADKSALEAVIAEANGLNENDYTAESWAAMQLKLADAVDVFEDEAATQAAVDAAKDALRAAIDALETRPEPVDKSALEAVIAEASGLNENDYTAESWAAMQLKLADAVDVFEDEAATQTAVDASKDALRTAIDALETRPEPVDKSALEAVIAEANGLNENDYTAESWAAMQLKLADAVDVFEDEAATQAAVDAAKDALRTAIDALETKPVEGAPVISGIEDGGFWRGGVRLTADKVVTWTVNGVELPRKGANLVLGEDGFYSVFATDGEGRVSNTLTFTIDRDRPVLSSEQVGANGMTNQDVTVRADEDVRFELDGVAIEGYSRELTVTGSGRHVVKAYDRAGNYSGVFVFTIDQDAPVLSTNFFILNGVTRYNVAVTADERVDYYVNGELVAENEYRCKFLEPGVYEVKAKDKAGNESNTIKFEIRR